MFYRSTFATVTSYSSKSTPLTLKAIEDCTIGIINNAEDYLYYCVDGLRVGIPSGETGSFDLTADQEVEFYGDNATYSAELGGYTNFTINGQCYIYGNIMSLISSTDFANLTEFTSPGVFSHLFSNCSNLRNHPEKRLLLPATTLTSSCYESMFEYCTGLTQTPDLPATTLQEGCYNCMFEGCKNLTTAPELPAPTLVKYCYQFMFADCSNLNSVTCFATNMSANNCTYDWLRGVASSGTFTKAADANWSGIYAAGGIPSGWTVVDK